MFSIHSCDDTTGDKDDIKRACKKVMNKTVSKRIISKQEACVLLADLDLVCCTESIQNISISNTKCVTTDGTAKGTKTLIKKYSDRPAAMELESLHKYFLREKRGHGKKPIFPNFVGVNGTPKYPVTDDYARHTLIVHKPWRVYPKDLDWKTEFNAFINSPDCPLSARMGYMRVMRRFIDKMTHYEAKATTCDHSGNALSPEDEELMLLVGLKDGDECDFDDVMFEQMEKGLDHSWDSKPLVSQLEVLLINFHIDCQNCTQLLVPLLATSTRPGCKSRGLASVEDKTTRRSCC